VPAGCPEPVGGVDSGGEECTFPFVSTHTVGACNPRAALGNTIMISKERRIVTITRILRITPPMCGLARISISPLMAIALPG
jgi:hypothetical protein